MSDESYQIPEPNINELKNSVLRFEQRKKRARERMRTMPRDEWNFAIVGLTGTNPNISVEGIAEFRAVVEPPGEIELAGALENAELFGAIGRYSHHIGHELVVKKHLVGDHDQAIFNRGWWLISAIRIKTGAEFLIPAVANCSWSVIAAIEDNSCKARLLEDVPQTRILDTPIVLVEEDLRWAFRNVLTLGNLLEVPRFRLAVDALTTHQHLLSPRMMAAAIWAGIEALMGVSNELRYRLAISAASLLEARGTQRFDRYCQIKKLYDVRSVAVHGSEIDKAALLRHVIESRKLLSALLCSMIQAQKVYSKEEIERNVLD